MKLASIDIETSGLNAEKDLTLEIGIILYDSKVHGNTFTELDFSKLPRLCLRLIHPKESFDHLKPDGAVYKMNKELIDNLRNGELDSTLDYTYIYPDAVQEFIISFLFTNEFITTQEYVDLGMSTSRLTAVGKNFGSFDRRFLEKLFSMKSGIKINHRTIDPAVLYLNIDTDELVPSLDECIKRSGLFLEDKVVSHTSVQDAEDTLKLTLFKLLKLN